jgi:hypothetical protein
MLRTLTDVAVRIVPRVSADGHAFTELLHTWTEQGQRHNALSRVNYAIGDAPHSRARLIQSFVKRQLRDH